MHPYKTIISHTQLDTDLLILSGNTDRRRYFTQLWDLKNVQGTVKDADHMVENIFKLDNFRQLDTKLLDQPNDSSVKHGKILL